MTPFHRFKHPRAGWDFIGVIGVAIIFALFALAATCVAAPHARATWRPTSTWHWTGDPRATGYRLRWSTSPSCWPAANVVDVSGFACTPSGDCHGDIPMPAGDLVYIIVTASNARGESVTEHGPVAAVCNTP